uniref:Uncharacterized protein n=1 Tax=Salix viminalis TaxID=40686 RepID=A0A6N2NI35_SALVM
MWLTIHHIVVDHKDFINERPSVLLFSATLKMAAAKTLSPHPFPPISLPSKSKLSRNNTELFTHHHNRQPWLGQAGAIPTRQKRVMARVSVQLQEHLLSSSAVMEQLQNQESMFLVAESAAGYSLASYYTSLGLFVISVPGLWSLIKRSVKSKRASRKEEIKVKMMVADDGTLSEIVVQGDDQQVEQMRKELQFSEKGMVYVKGIFER